MMPLKHPPILPELGKNLGSLAYFEKEIGNYKPKPLNAIRG